VLDFEAPAPSSFYSMDIRGPFFKCEPPNSSQIPVFDYYQGVLYLDPVNVAMVTQDTLPLVLQLFNTTSHIVRRGSRMDAGISRSSRPCYERFRSSARRKTFRFLVYWWELRSEFGLWYLGCESSCEFWKINGLRTFNLPASGSQCH
jgi:hypothetical protein